MKMYRGSKNSQTPVHSSITVAHISGQEPLACIRHGDLAGKVGSETDTLGWVAGTSHFCSSAWGFKCWCLCLRLLLDETIKILLVRAMKGTVKSGRGSHVDGHFEGHGKCQGTDGSRTGNGGSRRTRNPANNTVAFIRPVIPKISKFVVGDQLQAGQTQTWAPYFSLLGLGCSLGPAVLGEREAGVG